MRRLFFCQGSCEKGRGGEAVASAAVRKELSDVRYLGKKIAADKQPNTTIISKIQAGANEKKKDL